MNTTNVLALPTMSVPQDMPETLVPRSPGYAAVDPAAWGLCEIRLVADRVASLRAGSTHKVYRGWRFAVTMHHGHPRPGTTLFTIPIDPAHLAACGSRYAMVQLANQGAVAVGGPAAFAWSAVSIGTADPVATALEQARQHLDAAGWSQDVANPTRYAKPDLTMRVRGEPEVPSSDIAAHAMAASRSATEPGTLGSGSFPMANMSQPEDAGLDEWETDGGTGSTVSERSSALGLGTNRGS